MIRPPIERRTDNVEPEEPPEPLQDLLARQRARCDRLLALSLEERSALIAGVSGRDGNGSGD
jgi:hypothetical protein